mgnify:CR=1 FL=1
MPIIGKGDIATVIRDGGLDKDKFTFFCSGVSNSSELRESEYQREIDLLLSQDRAMHLVYFSSLSIFYANTLYTRHKLFMESLVKSEFPYYTIIRMGNIVWGEKNPHTLINFIRNKIRNRELFEIQDVYRYVIDEEEFLHWINLIPPWPCELNIPGRKMKVKDIVKEYCYPWGKSDGTVEHEREMMCSSI